MSSLPRMEFWRGTGKDSRWTNVGVLVQSLADLEPQTPQRDVVRDIRISCGSEKDSVFSEESIESVYGHHHAVLTEIIPTPVVVLKFEGEGALGESKRFKNLPSGWYHFFANAIARNSSNTVCL